VFAIDWRSVMVGVVFLIDLIVFADLVRAELREARTPHRRRDERRNVAVRPPVIQPSRRR
jgi:hypothetical protein